MGDEEESVKVDMSSRKLTHCQPKWSAGINQIAGGLK